MLNFCSNIYNETLKQKYNQISINLQLFIALKKYSNGDEIVFNFGHQQLFQIVLRCQKWFILVSFW